MIRNILIGTFILAGLASNAENKLAASTELTKEEAQNWLNDFAATWATHDPAKLAAHFESDGGLINPWNRRASGTAELTKLFQEEMSRGLGQSTQVYTVEGVHNLGANLASVDAAISVNNVVGPRGKKIPTMNLHIFAVWSKKSGSWKIAEARPYHFKGMHARHHRAKKGRHGQQSND